MSKVSYACEQLPHEEITQPKRLPDGLIHNDMLPYKSRR